VTPQPDDRQTTATDHPVEELAPLIGGELELPELRAVVRHVRGCASCKDELVEVAAAVGALLHVEHGGLAEPAQPPALTIVPDAGAAAPVGGAVVPLARARRRVVTERLLAVAAAVAIVLGVGVVIGRHQRGSGSAGGPTVQVALAPVGSSPAGGTVAMAGTGGDRIMTVSTRSLTAAPAGSYYEVWLLEPTSGHMVAVGVLGSDGSGRYSLPTDVVQRYKAVDISLQPDNGSTVHSNDSVLRASYA